MQEKACAENKIRAPVELIHACAYMLDQIPQVAQPEPAQTSKRKQRKVLPEEDEEEPEVLPKKCRGKRVTAKQAIAAAAPAINEDDNAGYESGAVLTTALYGLQSPTQMVLPRRYINKSRLQTTVLTQNDPATSLTAATRNTTRARMILMHRLHSHNRREPGNKQRRKQVRKKQGRRNLNRPQHEGTTANAKQEASLQ